MILFDKAVAKILLKILVKGDLRSNDLEDVAFMAGNEPLFTKLIEEGLVLASTGACYPDINTPITSFSLTGKGQATLNEMLAHPYTIEEHKVDTKLIDAHNAFISLPSTHPSEQTDWVFHLHALQQILAMRILRRDYPHKFVTKE